MKCLKDLKNFLKENLSAYDVERNGTASDVSVMAR